MECGRRPAGLWPIGGLRDVQEQFANVSGRARTGTDTPGVDWDMHRLFGTPVYVGSLHAGLAKRFNEKLLAQINQERVRPRHPGGEGGIRLGIVEAEGVRGAVLVYRFMLHIRPDTSPSPHPSPLPSLPPLPQARNPGRQVSNRGGWQSDGQLLWRHDSDGTPLAQIHSLVGRDLDLHAPVHPVHPALQVRMAAYSLLVDSQHSTLGELYRLLPAGVPRSGLRVEQVVVANGWANVNNRWRVSLVRDCSNNMFACPKNPPRGCGRGHYNSAHGHGHLLAGVYYVAGGRCGKHGMLEMRDPRVQARHAPFNGLAGMGGR